MPRRDGTGPDNEGPKTGRGLGPCNTKDTKDTKDQPVRRGRGMANRHGRRINRRGN